MMHVKMMIFAAGKRRCGDPDRGGRFVRHHGILYMYQTFLSLFASNEPKLSPSVFDTNACPLSLYINRTQRKAHSWLFKCVYLKSYFKRIDFVGQLKEKKKIFQSLSSPLCVVCVICFRKQKKREEALSYSLSFLLSRDDLVASFICSYVCVFKRSEFLKRVVNEI